ncbi:LmbE family protein [Desulfovibrio sp. X2]|uniref:PIG-L deacetylase family protein n=1 Tax=Desulfovibrio sp. X2 TaxID=941449 RepID=UPI000358E643|nr:PIG-L family deacetylase [Desulfovibrio sp. X2]EPR37508.1 LmbE family protein [Desulfovibrio sp. X2]
MSKTVLSFGLTPGDIAMGCGGSVTLLTDQGWNGVNIFCAYSGENLNTLAKEARLAARLLGVSEVGFLLVDPGAEMFGREAVLRAAHLIRKHKPDLIFTFSSQDPSPDRTGLSCCVRAAVQAASAATPEIEGTPHQVQTVFGYEIAPPLCRFGHAVNITETVGRKMDAINCYETLIGRKVEEAMQGLARYRGRMSDAGEFAEVFEILHGEHDPFHDWRDD